MNIQTPFLPFFSIAWDSPTPRIQGGSSHHSSPDLQSLSKSPRLMLVWLWSHQVPSQCYRPGCPCFSSAAWHLLKFSLCVSVSVTSLRTLQEDMVARLWFSKSHHANGLPLLRVHGKKVKVKVGQWDDWGDEGLVQEPWPGLGVWDLWTVEGENLAPSVSPQTYIHAPCHACTHTHAK